MHWGTAIKNVSKIHRPLPITEDINLETAMNVAHRKNCDFSYCSVHMENIKFPYELNTCKSFAFNLT